MKKYLILFCIVINSALFAQFDLGAGMGLNFFSSPDLRDYINSTLSSEEMSSFNTSADFFIELGYNISEKYQISAEYTFNIYSVNANTGIGIYDLQINQHKPSILAYYIISGIGYKFKLGGGAGYRIGLTDEKQQGTTQVFETTANGFGFLLKAQGDTKLSGNFYALIAGEIRYDIYDDIETFTPGVTYNISSFGFALKLGTVYYF